MLILIHQQCLLTHYYSLATNLLREFIRSDFKIQFQNSRYTFLFACIISLTGSDTFGRYSIMFTGEMTFVTSSLLFGTPFLKKRVFFKGNDAFQNVCIPIIVSCRAIIQLIRPTPGPLSTLGTPFLQKQGGIYNNSTVCHMCITTRLYPIYV